MKKLVTILLVLALVLSLSSVAFAANLSDTKDLSKDAQASIAKLNALGVVNGYPDGTFKPANTITRAEFAKIAVVVSGMKDSAEALKGTASQFSDVKAGSWYVGWVNLAASQSFVKGFPDGTFRPNAPITNAEVVTVLLRVLGYNDNLPGPWPVDYIAKAAALDITEDVAFNASAPATRVDVAVMADATLDATEVEWDADQEQFNDKTHEVKGDEEELTLLEDSFDSAIDDDVALGDWTYDTHDKQFSVDLNDESTVVATDAQFAGAAQVSGLNGNIGDVIYNEDDEVAFVDVTSTCVTVKGEDITYNYDNKDALDDIEVSDVTYDVADDADIPDDIDDDTYYDVYTNDDDEIYTISADTTPGSPEIVDEYDAADQTLTTLQDDYDLEDQDVLVSKNGMWVTVADIAANDIVYMNEDSHDVDFYIQVKPWKEGTYSQAYGSEPYTAVKVAGVKYPTAEETTDVISRNSGEDFDYSFNEEGVDGLSGKTVKYFLNKAYQVAYIMTDIDAGASDDKYGIIVDTTETNSRTDGWQNDSLTILLADGTTVSYELGDDADDDSEAYFEDVDQADIDSFVTFTLDEEGNIDSIEEAGTPGTINKVDETRKTIQIDGEWYDFNDSTVVYNTYPNDTDDDEEAVVEKLSVLNEDAEDMDVTFKANSDDELEYVVFGDKLSTSAVDDYALITDTYSVDGDLWADVDVRGEIKPYQVDTDGETESVLNAVYKYDFSGDEISFSDGIDFVNDATDEGNVDSYSTTANTVTVDGHKYFLDADTYIFDYTDADSPAFAKLNDMEKGDDDGSYAYVFTYADDTDQYDDNPDTVQFIFFVDHIAD